MYKNIILGSILVLFFSFQIATSLKCLVSITPTKYESENCTKESAKFYTNMLSTLYNVSEVETDSFNCFSFKLTEKIAGKYTTTMKGCGFKSLNCSVSLHYHMGKIFKSEDCTVCDKDNCNPPELKCLVTKDNGEVSSNICTKSIAEKSLNYLSTFFKKVNTTETYNYKCLYVRLEYNNATKPTEYQSCVDESSVEQYILKDDIKKQNVTYSMKLCNTTDCNRKVEEKDKDKDNGNNPAKIINFSLILVLTVLSILMTRS